VTSNDAGLSVPDWPTSFGSIYKMPPMVNGIQYEHSHRLIAWGVGALTIGIAVWTWLVDRRPWMKYLGIAALGTVILQGILGGITVLKFLPPLVSTAHAMVGQTFFCIAVTIAVFSGQRWVEEHPRVVFDMRKPSLVALTQLSILVLYVQLFLGSMFRHHGMSWWPHVVNAVAVAVFLTWTAVRALSQYAEIDAVRVPAVLLLSLMVAQLCLGFAAFITRVMWGPDAVQPEMPMIVSTVAHVAVGALLLATAVILAIQVWRHVPVALAEGSAERSPRAVAA
jgi:cytochrome c oxidase assembly protein subunit 15